MSENSTDLFGDLVYSYTRADALRDGVLLALTQAGALGFRVPVAITQAAHTACIDWPHPDPKLAQILHMREEVVLLCARTAAHALRRRHQRGSEERADRIDFTVEAVQLIDHRAQVVHVPLYMVIGPGDNAEPVGTIMMIGED